MYIVSFYITGRAASVSTDLEGIHSMINLLESSATYFKVSNSAGYIDQEDLGVGGYTWWLKPEDSFRRTS